MKKTLKTYLAFSLVASMLIPGTAMAGDDVANTREPASVQQGKAVKGHVVDENGEPLVGVTVKIVGVNGGAVTDMDGNFTLTGAEGRKLQLSYTGYKTITVTASSGTMNITMDPDVMGLDDVVVIGYGTMKKRDLTGSVSSVKSDEIAKIPTVNVMEAIQGQVAGFDITRTKGELGNHLSMTLRGNRSIYGNNEPLFIIDGMEGSFDAINPNDIESVEVLKDASSTAIYGSAGANGVIIITTKNAKKGKFQVNLDAYYGVNKATSFPEVNTGDDYINFRREAAKTVGQWSSSADDPNIFPSYLWGLIQNNQWVDWFDLATQTGTTQNYNLSTSYSNDRMSSYFSLGYNDTEGIIRDEQMKRYSARAKVDFTPNRYLDYGLNLYALYQDYDHMNGRLWNRIICTPPLGTPYDENGDMVLYPVGGNTGDINPLADLNKGEYVSNSKTLTVMPQIYAEVKPIDGLSLKTILGGTFSNVAQGVFIGNKSFNGLATGSEASTPNTFTYNYQWQNILTYNLKVGDMHEFVFTGITDWEKNRRQYNMAKAFNFDENSYAYHNLGAGTGTPQVSSSYVQSQTMSYALRVNYSLLNRYLFTLSGRWDGSSMLAKGKKWDFFPAAAFAWRISDEAFMENTKDWLSNLKLRVSYGVTGNAGAAEYATLDYSRTGNIGFQDVSQPYSGYSQNIANLDLGWEKSTMVDVGLDVGLFNGRLEIVADYYKTTTKDLLFQKSLPYAVGGYGSSSFKIWTNVGKTQNTGFELAINSRNILTKDFTWTTAFTFATNKEKVVKTTSENPLQFGDYYLISGEPVHTYYLYKYLGIWGTAEEEEAAKYGQKPGQIHIADKPDEEGNIDGKINADDYYVIGHADPNWSAGLINTFTYKGFDLSVQLIARWGWTIRYGLTGWYRLDGLSPSPKVCDFWTPENQGARYPQPNMNGSQDTYQGNSSLNYFDASYVKVKNITLGYTLPKNLLKPLHINSLRVYATANNPFIFAKDSYLKNYDLEKGGDDDDAPLTKQFVFGVNVTF
ncbi:MAG: TonB-dependent receptor [Prevotella sp.]|nr:TonB-dependent receptor [Prevotella sp.]